MKYRKNLLPTNTYYTTITQAYIQEIKKCDNITLCFTIDRGEYSYRNLIKHYPLNEYGLDKLEKDFISMGYVIYDNTQKDYFTTQFVGKRAKLSVARAVVDNVIRNEIIEFQLADLNQEHDVTREKTDDHYFRNVDGEIDLPI